MRKAAGTHPFDQRGSQLTGDDSGSASHRVYNVHQARTTKGVWGWGMTFGENKKRSVKLNFFVELKHFRPNRTIAGLWD